MGDDESRIAGTMIRRHREAAGLTQHDLARAAGVSVGVIRDFEQGRTTRLRPKSADGLARALHLDNLAAARLRGEISGSGPVEAGPASGLWLTVLGPLTAWRDGAPLELGPPMRRTILGLLALRPGELVCRDSVIDVLWPASPPATAVNQVQAHIGRLRRVLDPLRSPSDPRGLLVSEGSGYRLRPGISEFDLLSFRHLADRAAAARAAGDTTAACRWYDEALRLWQDEPLAGVAQLAGHPCVVALAQLRSAVVAACAQACCDTGRYAQALVHLQPQAAREPLDERLHALMVIALAGSGRRAAALRVFDQIRQRLDDELGVRPCPELARARQRVLRGDIAAPASDSIRVAPEPPAPEPSAQVVPRQVPPPVPDFTGRAAELEKLTSLLDQAGGAMRPVVISAIGGTAGVGKTALARHWAHMVTSRFPDGQLYVNLNGYGLTETPADPADAVRNLLDGLGVPAASIPAGMDAQVGLYRSLLAERRVLIVLDNAKDEAQVRPLLPASRRSMVLVTSRSQLPGLVAVEGAWPITLDMLSEAEAREFLIRRLGAQRVASEPGPAAELADMCARLPIALAVCAARAIIRSGLPLAMLVAELRAADPPLDAFDTGDSASSVRVVFSWSYRNLTDRAARMFRLLGVHPGPDISVPAAASLASVSVGQARRALAELARAHLIAEHVPGRFTCHDLLRAYAAELAGNLKDSAQRDAATGRLLDFYLHTAHAAYLRLDPMARPLDLTPLNGQVRPEPIADAREGADWLRAEQHVLLAAVAHAGRSGFDRHAWQLAWTLTAVLDRQGRWRELIAAQLTGLAAGQRLGDEFVQAHAQHQIGRGLIRLGRSRQALYREQRAASRFARIGDVDGQARAHIGIGWSLAEQNRYPEALRHSRLAMRLFARAGDQHGRAGALNNIGWFHILAGDAEAGIGYCVQARDLFGEIANREGEAIAWDSIGQGQQRLTRHPQAIASFGARCASSATSAISTISPIVSPTSVTPSGTPGSTRPRRDPGVRPWTSWTACPTRPLTGSATACERWADRGVDSGSRS